jgi:hypothetical protein
MYESPIKLIQQQMNTEIESEVFNAIIKVGVDVNKEELLKALQYDREQYQKGYNDGVKDFAERVKILLFNYHDSDIDELAKEMESD